METTHPLTIEFRDGFHEDTVIVTADGDEVYRQPNVTTRTMIGFAGSTNLQLKSGQHSLGVFLKEKEVSLSIDIDLQKPLYLGLDYNPEKGLEYQLQGEQFKYM